MAVPGAAAAVLFAVALCGRQRVDNALAVSEELAVERERRLHLGLECRSRKHLGAGFFLTMVCSSSCLRFARSCTRRPVVSSAAASGRWFSSRSMCCTSGAAGDAVLDDRRLRLPPLVGLGVSIRWWSASALLTATFQVRQPPVVTLPFQGKLRQP